MSEDQKNSQASNNNHENAPNKASRQDSGFIPYIFIIFFAIIFIVNFSYIYISQKTWRGIYTKNSYQKGLKYNQTLEYVKQQKANGLELDANFFSEKNNIGKLTVCLLDKNKQFIKDAKLIAKITRPTQEGFDFTQNLSPQKNCFVATINFPLKGLWNVEIQAFADKNVVQIVKRYVVQ